jgi:hypothetical protein
MRFQILPSNHIFWLVLVPKIYVIVLENFTATYISAKILLLASLSQEFTPRSMRVHVHMFIYV